MVVESRRDTYELSMPSLQFSEEAHNMFAVVQSFTWQTEVALVAIRRGESLSRILWSSMFHSREAYITNSTDHYSLKLYLISHIWDLFGST